MQIHRPASPAAIAADGEVLGQGTVLQLDGEETASGVTWGTYAVQGTWDGEQFTVTRPPIMLAVYDSMVVSDPYRDPGKRRRNR